MRNNIVTDATDLYKPLFFPIVYTMLIEAYDSRSSMLHEFYFFNDDNEALKHCTELTTVVGTN